MNDNKAIKQKRHEGFELLRIVAMLMIISLHFLDKGRVLPDLKEPDIQLWGYAAWLLEAFCIVSVNAFVLVSGYFLSRSSFNKRRLMELWTQVLFYSIIIGIIGYFAGWGQEYGGGIVNLLRLVFPITMEHYWFATAYVVLYLLAPFLNKGMEKLGQSEYRTLLVLLLGFFSLSKTLIPIYNFPWDNHGYDAMWFVVLYLLGGYIGRFGEHFLQKARIGLALYIISAIGIFLATLAIRKVYLITGRYSDIMDCCYDYNYILALTGALGFFGLFHNVRIKSEKAKAVILKLAGGVFGVYLLHEHLYLRYRWPEWIGVKSFADSFGWILVWAVSVTGIFIAGVVVDFIRQRIFTAISGIIRR